MVGMNTQQRQQYRMANPTSPTFAQNLAVGATPDALPTLPTVANAQNIGTMTEMAKTATNQAGYANNMADAMWYDKSMGAKQKLSEESYNNQLAQSNNAFQNNHLQAVNQMKQTARMIATG